MMMNSQTVEGADHLLRHQSHLCLSTKEVSEIAAQLQSSNEERSGSLQRLSSILDDIRAKTMKRQQEQTEKILQHLRSPVVRKSSCVLDSDSEAVKRRSTHSSDFKLQSRDMLDEAFETFQTAMDGSHTGLSYLSSKQATLARLTASTMKAKLMRALRHTSSPPPSPAPNLSTMTERYNGVKRTLQVPLSPAKDEEAPSPEEVRLLRALKEAAELRARAEIALMTPKPPAQAASPSHSPLWQASPAASPAKARSSSQDDVAAAKDQDLDCQPLPSAPRAPIQSQTEIEVLKAMDISEAGSDLSLSRFVHSSTSPILISSHPVEHEITPSRRVKRKARRLLVQHTSQDSTCVPDYYNAWPPPSVARKADMGQKCPLLHADSQTDGTGSLCFSCLHLSAIKDAEIANLKLRIRCLLTSRDEGERKPRLTMSSWEDLLDEAEADLESLHGKIHEAAERQVELQEQNRKLAESISISLRSKDRYAEVEAENELRLVSLQVSIGEVEEDLKKRQKAVIDMDSFIALKKRELSEWEDGASRKEEEMERALQQLDCLISKIEDARQISAQALKEASENTAEASEARRQLEVTLAELRSSAAVLSRSRESVQEAELRLEEIEQLRSEVSRRLATLEDQAKESSEAFQRDQLSISNDLARVKDDLKMEMTRLSKCQSACFDYEFEQKELQASIGSLQAERRQLLAQKAELESELLIKGALIKEASEEHEATKTRASSAKEELSSLKSEVSKATQRLEDMHQALVLLPSHSSSGGRDSSSGGRDSSSGENGQLRGLRIRVEELESEAQEARQSASRARSKLADAKDEIAALEDALHREEANAARLKQRLTLHRHQPTIVHEEEEVARGPIAHVLDEKAKDEEVDGLREQVKGLQTRLLESESLVLRLELDLLASKRAMETAEVDKRGAEATIRKLEARIQQRENESSESSASFEMALAEAKRSQQLTRMMEEELERTRSHLRESRVDLEGRREEILLLGSQVTRIEKALAESEGSVLQAHLKIHALESSFEGERSQWQEAKLELKSKILELEEEAVMRKKALDQKQRSHLEVSELEMTCERLKASAALQESEMRHAREASEVRLHDLESKFMSLMERYSEAEAEEEHVRSSLDSLTLAIQEAEAQLSQLQGIDESTRLNLEAMGRAISEAHLALEEAERQREASRSAEEQLAIVENAKGDLTTLLSEEAIVRSRHEMFIEEAGSREEELATCLSEAAEGLEELRVRVDVLHAEETRLMEALRLARLEEAEVRSRTREMESRGRMAFDEVRGLCHQIDEASVAIDEMAATMILSEPEPWVESRSTYMQTEVTALTRESGSQTEIKSGKDASTMTVAFGMDCGTETEIVQLVSRGVDAVDLSPPCPDCSACRYEVMEARVQAEALTSARETLVDRLNSLEQESKEDLEKAEEKIKALESECEIMQLEASVLQATIKRLESQIEDLSQSKAEAASEADQHASDLERRLMEASLLDAELRERLHREEGIRLDAESLIGSLRQELSEAETHMGALAARMDRLDEESAALKRMREARGHAGTQTELEKDIGICSIGSQTQDSGSQVLETQLASFRKQILEQDEILQVERLKLEDVRKQFGITSASLSQAESRLAKMRHEMKQTVESEFSSVQRLIRGEIEDKIEAQEKHVRALKSSVESDLSALSDDRARIVTEALEAKQLMRSAMRGLASCRAAHSILSRISEAMNQDSLLPPLLDQLGQHLAALEDLTGASDGRSSLSNAKLQVLEEKVGKAVNYTRSKSAAFELLLTRFLDMEVRADDPGAAAVKKGFEAFWYSSLKQFDRLEKSIQKLKVNQHAPRSIAFTTAVQCKGSAGPLALLPPRLQLQEIVPLLPPASLATQASEPDDELDDLLGVPS